jgi:hypothetical protein
VSITDLIASKGLQALLARAATAYGTMGIGGSDIQRCIEYTVRYGLGAARICHEKTPVEFYKAIAHVACHQVADLIAGTAAGAPPKRRTPRSTAPAMSSSLSYWVDKVCEVLGIDTWLDDSLDKWFLDTHGPLADVLVQACRRRVMDYLATIATSGAAADHDDLVIDIAHDLQARFPAIARFNRHLPSAIANTIEQDVLGIPLVDKAEPVTPAGITGIVPDVIIPRAASVRSSYSTSYPEQPATIDSNTNTQMRQTYP